MWSNSCSYYRLGIQQIPCYKNQGATQLVKIQSSNLQQLYAVNSVAYVKSNYLFIALIFGPADFIMSLNAYYYHHAAFKIYLRRKIFL